MARRRGQEEEQFSSAAAALGLFQSCCSLLRLPGRSGPDGGGDNDEGPLILELVLKKERVKERRLRSDAGAYTTTGCHHLGTTCEERQKTMKIDDDGSDPQSVDYRTLGPSGRLEW